MFKTAEEVRHVYKLAEDADYLEDLQDAMRASEWLDEKNLDREGMIRGIKARMLKTPKHPRTQKGSVLGMTAFGAGLGGLAGIPASILTPRAVPVGVGMGGAFGLYAGLKDRAWRKSPDADGFHRRNLAAQRRRQADPERLQRIADEVADEWEKWQ